MGLHRNQGLQLGCGALPLSLPPHTTPQNKPLVGRVVLLIAHGLNIDRAPAALESLLGAPIQLRARSATLDPAQSAHALLTTPGRRQGGGGGAGTGAKEALPGPGHYVLTLDQLEEHGYPLPVFGEDGDLELPDGYIATRAGEWGQMEWGTRSGATDGRDCKRAASLRWPTAGPRALFSRHACRRLPWNACRMNLSPQPAQLRGAVAEGSPPAQAMVALDCEMCRTCVGLELARVVLLDGAGELLLDLLVRPANPVLDHLTRWSGITPDMIAAAEAGLAEARAAVMTHVAADTLLVGHGLENDLHALKASQPCVCACVCCA